MKDLVRWLMNWRRWIRMRRKRKMMRRKGKPVMLVQEVRETIESGLSKFPTSRRLDLINFRGFGF